jgi:phage gpG-like protein
MSKVIQLIPNPGDMSRARKTMAKLRRFPKSGLNTEIAKYIFGIRKKAAQRVVRGKVQGGTLAGSIDVGTSDKKGYVQASADYAPYVEFGTGGSYSGADLDELFGTDSYASQFKGASQDRVHLPARPFLFNSARELLPDFIKGLQKRLRKARS